jgi:acetyltransferase-like isoleucine patch superfamily enzyme
VRYSPWDTPWKVWNELLRWLQLPYARVLFAWHGIPFGQRWKLFGLPIIQKHRLSQMQFGSGLSLRSSVRSNPLAPYHPVVLCTWQAGAVLEVGQDFGMTGGTLCAAERITIGNRVTIGANSMLVDTDFHPLEPHLRRLQPGLARPRPVVVEDDVFIGMHCLVLKGVTLGQGCVIGAGSLVRESIPPGMIAAGNPARVLRRLDSAQIV